MEMRPSYKEFLLCFSDLLYAGTLIVLEGRFNKVPTMRHVYLIVQAHRTEFYSDCYARFLLFRFTSKALFFEGRLNQSTVFIDLIL